MAAVNITISGVLCDKYGRTITPCTIVGSATLTGLGVGGGPIIPPEGEKPPGSPPGIWPGPGDPDFPGGGKPPGIWGGGNEPFPTPPIVIPPVPPDMPKPPDLFDWHVAWTPNTGWVVVAIPTFDHPAPSVPKK